MTELGCQAIVSLRFFGDNEPSSKLTMGDFGA